MALSHKYVELGPFKLVGMQTFTHVSVAPRVIPALWNEFVNLKEEIKAHSEPGVYYGFEYYPPDFMRDHNFFYMVGTPVESLHQVHVGLVGREIPASRYIVFEHYGPVTGVSSTFRRIYDEELPQMEIQPKNCFDFERYDHRFDPESEDTLVEIYIPLG